MLFLFKKKVPEEYKNKLEGICGTWDGVKSNDFTTKDGVDVRKDSNKFTLVGNSWQVFDPLLPG